MTGLRDGDRVVVHSSLRAVGLDADELLDELLATVGPDGLVLAPASWARRSSSSASAPSHGVATA